MTLNKRLRLILVVAFGCFAVGFAESEASLSEENDQLRLQLSDLEVRLTRLEHNHASELQAIRLSYHQDLERLHHDMLQQVQPQQHADSDQLLRKIESLEMQLAETQTTIRNMMDDRQNKATSEKDDSSHHLQLMKDMESRLRKDYFDDMGSMQLWLQQEYVRATDQVKKEHRRALDDVETRMLETHAKDLLDLKTEMIVTVNQHAETVAALDGKVDMCYNQHMQQANKTQHQLSQPSGQTTSLRGMSSPSSYFTPVPATTAEDATSHRSVLALNATLASLQSQFQSLASSLKCLNQEMSDDGDLYFVGCNIHIRNGLDDTITNNARGNLIIGYNEQTSACGVSGNIYCKRSGSHNLIMGVANEYTNCGGIVTGHHNEMSGEFASILGGTLNVAKGYHSSVAGGMQNRATGDYAYVSGGMKNQATGNFAQVLGGSKTSVAKGDFSSVFGGESNTANAWFGSIVGGQENEVNGQYSLIAGGTKDKTLNYKGSTILGGSGKQAEGEYTTVIGFDEHAGTQSSF